MELRSAALGARLAALAATFAGGFMVLKGVVMALGGPDLDVPPIAFLLLALSLPGLHSQVRGRSGQWGKLGGILAYVAVATAVIEMTAGLVVLTVSAPGSEGSVFELAWPVHVVLLTLASLATIVGLVVLGVAARRAAALPDRWRSVPLAVGVLWLPVFAVGEALGDVISPDREISLGFIPVGLAWIAVGCAIWPRPREQQRHSTTDPPVPIR